MDKKQRILTVDDLYKCCVENDILYFSAEDSNKRLVVSTQGYFEAEEDDEIQETEGLMGLKVKIFHTGKNRNKSFISKENTEKYMSSIKNRPLLAYIHQLPDGSYDFKQHDRRTVVNADGEEEIEYLESPIGHFTNDEPWLEEDEKKKDRYYVLGKAVVYEEYTKACEILKNKNGSDCSVELEIQDFSFDAKSKTLNIESFFIKGVTLLGSKVNVKTGKVEKVLPGMEGAKVTLEDFMSITSSDGCFENNEQKGGNEDMNKFEELLAKYNKAAEAVKKISSGDAQAQADLAGVLMALAGSLEQAGTSEDDYEQAFELAQKSADQNNGDGIWALALCYEHGRGVEANVDIAIELYERGAELGHAPSRHSLACYYFRGDVLEQDNKKAFELCMKSAEQGYGLAMADVGRCYQFGNGVMGNMKTAVEWYEKALEVIDDPELERKTAMFKMIGENDEHWGEDYPCTD